jgi:hypothetical protein
VLRTTVLRTTVLRTTVLRLHRWCYLVMARGYGSRYLGQHWAARGFITLFLQHPCSDEDIWQGKPLKELPEIFQQAANGENFQQRITGRESRAESNDALEPKPRPALVFAFRPRRHWHVGAFFWRGDNAGGEWASFWWKSGFYRGQMPALGC